MKKWFCFAVSLIAAVSVLSCTKIFGDDDPQVPVTGEGETFVFDCPEAYGYFNGQYEDNDGNLIQYDSYRIEFDSDGISYSNSGYAGTGYVAWIDIDTAHSETLSIPSGTYSSDSDRNGNFYAYPGEIVVDGGYGNIYPAFIAKYVNSQLELILATKVKLTVSVSGANYILKATLEGEDSNIFVFNYSGKFEIYDCTLPDTEEESFLFENVKQVHRSLQK